MHPLDDRDVTYGDVTFHIGKMMPIAAKRVFMTDVRPMLGGILEADLGDAGEGANATAALGLQIVMAAITKAPQERYDSLCRTLYRNITFTKGADRTKAVLLGDEEYAFEGLEMFHMLDLDFRAFYINFRGSWDGLISAYPQLALISARFVSAT